MITWPPCAPGPPFIVHRPPATFGVCEFAKSPAAERHIGRVEARTSERETWLWSEGVQAGPHAREPVDETARVEARARGAVGEGRHHAISSLARRRDADVPR